jgi:quinolinate synthase
MGCGIRRKGLAVQLTAADLYKKLESVKIGSEVCRYSLETCEQLVPKINRILKLKEEKNAIILAHSYVSPEIVYGVADFVGDSYGLSKDAMATNAKLIVFAAVKFMGDTAKILNPSKDVVVPGLDAGCTLADSITGQDVAELRKKYPDHIFMCYINTTADVKAHCDVCVTSSNVYNIVEKYPSDKIVFLPDRYMGENIIQEMQRRGVNKEIVLYEGTCYVHKEYDAEMVDFLKMEHPTMEVVAHPECKPEVVAKSDFVGSTEQMLHHIRKSTKEDFLLLTECGLTSRLQVEAPGKRFVGSCSLCKYMKSNTLDSILQSLESPLASQKVELEPTVMQAAKRCIEQMFEYAEK